MTMVCRSSPKEVTLPRKELDGILLLDKSTGITSNGALQQIKHLFHAKKAGHTGSLDPIATGMLPIVLGRATKFSQFFLNAEKKYETTIHLGIQTTTGDREGEVLEEKSPASFSLSQLEEVLSLFRGKIFQIPPMFSALKHQGKPLYELARKGITIERTAREVEIYELRIVEYQHPYLTLFVDCSKGTYIRTLAEDIGKSLRCGAHVFALRRLSVAGFEYQQMQTFSDLNQYKEEKGLSGIYPYLFSIEEAFHHLPMVYINQLEKSLLRTKKKMIVSPAVDKGPVRLYEQKYFLGLGEIVEDNVLEIRQWLNGGCN